MAPEIVPSSPQGQALQAAIQKQLAFLGWSTEDDPVMAEYCVVMLGNRKTAEQISTELSDLIGGDFDASFVTWLFDEVKKHYPEPSSASSAPSSSIPTGPSGSASHSGAGANGIPSRPPGPIGGGRNVFGAAVTGVKRGAREIDGPDGGERQQRQRFDAPTGPKGGKSLYDRVNGNNPQFAPGRNMGPVNNTGMPQPAFDAITQAVNAILAGAHPSILANIPFPALTAHPLSARLPPHIMAQAQASAVAQAQALAAMQNVWSNPAGGFPGPGGPGGPFNPNAPPFHPGGFGGPRGGPRGGPPPKPATPPVVLPSKPLQEALCKHATECTKPACPYSHPSPVATKESGLVLSSEPCEKQLKCEDPDCPKSHVSKAQKTHPPSAVSSADGPIAPSAPISRPPAGPPPAALPGAGEKPCKFGSACTRPGCVFLHPWDMRSDSGQVPCRYGAACTRADCHFSHPPHRPAPYNRAKYSATFNKPANAGSSPSPAAAGVKKEGAIGEWPKESAEHVSERLKRFSGGEAGKDDAERIVPGQQGGGDDHKVEIHLDDEDEKKDGAGATAEKVKEELKA
ncbi:mRNA-binding protein nab2 [Rhodotorula toruloides]